MKKVKIQIRVEETYQKKGVYVNLTRDENQYLATWVHEDTIQASRKSIHIGSSTSIFF